MIKIFFWALALELHQIKQKTEISIFIDTCFVTSDQVHESIYGTHITGK